MDDFLNGAYNGPGSGCRGKIAAEEYVDLLIRYYDIMQAKERYSDYCIQNINDNWSVIYAALNDIPPLSFGTYRYYTIPKLYGLMDESSMIASGIVKVQNRGNLNLTGRNVLIGFIDTGIDYMHRAFKDFAGNTRIISIWDQSDNTGETPEGFSFGSRYTGEMINRALRSNNPYDIVPVRDESGHGTFVAGIAAGSRDGTEFTGAAYESGIIMVKLRGAKKALRDFYMINDESQAYSESDIMLGIRYLLNEAQRQRMPLVICISVGTSCGPHTDGTPLTQLLNQTAQLPGVCVVCPMGNEGNERGHFRGSIGEGEEYESAEIRVGPGEKGFLLELWSRQPDTFSVEIVTPSGERATRIANGRLLSRRVEFVYEKAIIDIDYVIIETIDGNQLITMLFDNPGQGIWRVNVYSENRLYGEYNMWLPIRGFLSGDTYFLDSSPETTLTQPASGYFPISVGAYDHRNNSFWQNSGRGFAANGNIAPCIAAPGVDVYGPQSGGSHDGYTVKSGTSIAAAHVAGSAALLFEWKMKNDVELIFNTTNIKSFLIIGADRSKGMQYPNKQWGYGILDLSKTFDILAGVQT